MADDLSVRRRWKFTGRVLPERVGLTAPILTGEFQSSSGFEFGFSGSIAASQVLVDVGVSPPDIDIFTLRNAVEAAIREQVDFIGFSWGMSLDIEILTASAEDGIWQVFGADMPILYQESEHQVLKLDFHLMQAVLSDGSAGAMMADFREAMRVAGQTGFFCYRAIEACMQSFAEREKTNEKNAWELMRNKLQIDLDGIRAVKAKADWARHGKRGYISDAERGEIFVFTRDVMRRYFDFVVRGYVADQQLAVLKFPNHN